MDYGTLDLVATNSVSQSTLLYRMDRIEKFFSQAWAKILVAVVLILIAALVLHFTLFRKNRRYGGRRYGSSPRYTGRRR